MKLTLFASATSLAAAATGPCEPVKPGLAPIRDPFNVTTFMKDITYSQISRNVQVPPHYSPVFEDLSAAYESVKSYLGYRRMESYSPDKCAQYCNETKGCKGINIFILRDATVVPGVKCPNPPAMATYRCSLFSEPLVVTASTNVGQLRGPVDGGNATVSFQVRIRGSNAYNLQSSPVDYKCPTTVTVTVTATPSPTPTTF